MRSITHSCGKIKYQERERELATSERAGLKIMLEHVPCKCGLSGWLFLFLFRFFFCLSFHSARCRCIRSSLSAEPMRLHRAESERASAQIRLCYVIAETGQLSSALPRTDLSLRAREKEREREREKENDDDHHQHRRQIGSLLIRSHTMDGINALSRICEATNRAKPDQFDLG